MEEYHLTAISRTQPPKGNNRKCRASITNRACMPILLLVTLLLLTSCTPTTTRIGANHTPTVSTISPSACPSTLPATQPDEIQTCLTPHAMRLAYGIDSLIQQGFTGKGQAIIDLVSFGSPTLQQDMKVFDQTFNLPPADVQVISPLHVPTYDPRHDKVGWAQETEMDVQIIHALAPEAKVIVLQSPVAETEGIVGLPEYRQLQHYIIDHQLGSIVSMSWGASELTLQDTQAKQELQLWNDLFQQGTTQDHITYFASSGDTGATDYTDDKEDLAHIRTIGFAADSPWVTGVGGTTLQSNNDSTFQETAWSGSEGGFSRFYQMPSYQKLLPAAVLQEFNNRRGVPDVSADGDPYTGLPIYFNGQWSIAGGTSASAPIWAAIAAIANQMAGHPLGFINPGLYKLAASATYHQDFHDITQGNNSYAQAGVNGYTAAPGWDPVTGLGTPNARKLIPDLIAALK
jgi:subtilase family serine protease